MESPSAKETEVPDAEIRDVNWWQNLSTALPQLEVTKKVPSDEHLDSAASSRLNWYRALFPMIRRIGGHVDVATPPDSDVPAAVSCFLPPGRRPSAYSLTMSGWLKSLFLMGPRTTYRFQSTFLLGEKNWPKVLKPLGLKEHDGAYCILLATDPSHAGKGYAGKLLKWQIDRHAEQLPGVPVYLETATDYGQRVYEKIGFKEMTRVQVELDVDEQGFRMPHEGADGARQQPYLALRLMMLKS